SCPWISEEGLVRRTEVGGSTKEPRNVLRKHVQRFSRSIATSNTLCVGWKHGEIAVPSRRKVTLLHQLDFNGEVGILSTIRVKKFGPLLSSVSAALPDASCKVVIDTLRDKKLCIFREPIGFLAQTNFLFSEWFSMCGGSILLVWGAVSDMAV